jgi:hypothetical protein
VRGTGWGIYAKLITGYRDLVIVAMASGRRVFEVVYKRYVTRQRLI